MCRLLAVSSVNSAIIWRTETVESDWTQGEDKLTKLQASLSQAEEKLVRISATPGAVADKQASQVVSTWQFLDFNSGIYMNVMCL